MKKISLFAFWFFKTQFLEIVLCFVAEIFRRKS